MNYQIYHYNKKQQIIDVHIVKFVNVIIDVHILNKQKE